MKAVYGKLPEKELKCLELERRVLLADPEPFYAIQEINVYKRINSLSMINLFPKRDNLCGCGCGKELPRGRSRWASDLCSSYATTVFAVIQGRVETIKHLIGVYHGRKCSECGERYKGLELEHTIPVHRGGGGCWLNNYTLMCTSCHKLKTKRDRNASSNLQTSIEY